MKRFLKIARSARDPSKFGQPMMIHNVVEYENLDYLIEISYLYFRRPDEHKGKDRVLWTDKIEYFYRAPIVRFYYYMVKISFSN